MTNPVPVPAGDAHSSFSFLRIRNGKKTPPTLFIEILVLPPSVSSDPEVY